MVVGLLFAAAKDAFREFASSQVITFPSIWAREILWLLRHGFRGKQALACIWSGFGFDLRFLRRSRGLQDDGARLDSMIRVALWLYEFEPLI